MIWWLFAVAVAVVLGVLDAPASMLTDSQVLLATHTWSNILMNTLVVGCIFLCHQSWQMAYASQRWYRWTAFAVGFVLMAVVGVLFLFRTLGAWHEHEQFVPQNSQTIRATVHIHEISDGVYDPAMGTHYRQKAILTDLKWVDNLHKYKDNANTTHNPFGAEDEVVQGKLPKTMTVLLTAFANPKADFGVLTKAKPNTKTTMTLTISPVLADKKADGFDGYRWLRTRHIHANAKIHHIDGAFVSDNQTGIKTTLEMWRWQLREHFYQDWHALSPQDRQNKAITLSLLTGDRSLIDKQTKELYQLSGISHLLAISGTHVVFLAMMLAGAVIFVADRFSWVYVWVSRLSLRLWVMVGASLLYALFTGFDVPAVRTVYMLMAMAIARQLALPAGGSMLAWVALVMIWLDPFVLWQAGFWLSFVAVWLLMRYDEQMPTASLKTQAISLIKLQGWLFFAMLPVSLWLFGKVSLWGLIINLFAVGLFGLIIVPINLLAGVLFVVLPSVADVLWAVSGAILGLLHGLLSLIDDAASSWIYENLGVAGLLLMGLIIVPFVFPALGKKYAIIPCVALLTLVISTPKMHGLSVVALQDNPAYLLVRQSDADPDSVSGQANWLILADFENKLKTHEVNKLADELTDALKKHRISHLTGVVVQTPNAVLHEAVQILGKNIPIYRYWHAGDTLTLPSTIPVLSCSVGISWQGEGLSVSALTGWGQIKDKTVWGCTLALDTKTQPSRLIINGANHERTWQLYEMLCHTIEPEVQLWLSHPKAVQNDETLARFAPKKIIHNPNALP